ncbi:MAG: hypothetical protein R3185_02220, partial [Candidatus Thermoplasmatota archaeon]|nr:hypothetical protein [Candidatus Thermoplasmatota archaeon]
MSTLASLASGTLEATALVLLAFFLYQARHQVGLIPLIFLLAALSFLLPFGAHAASMEFGDQGVAPQVYAIVVPVFVALTLMLHLLWGARNALVTALLPAAAGVLAGGIALLSGTAPLFIPDPLLPPSAGGAALAGISGSLGTLSALFVFHSLSKLGYDDHMPALFVPAVLTGTGVQGFTLYVAQA